MYRRTSRLAVCLVVVSLAASADTISFTSTKALNLPVTADAMTLGPDGNLWILDSQHNSVGQLTPSGGYTSFAIPTPQARPWAIVVGADGNLWFTEAQLPGKIARVTPAGAMTEYPIPATMLGNPWSMAATADGSIWFLELGDPSKAHNLDRVGRLDAKGTFSEFQVKNAVKLDAIAPAFDSAWLFDDDPSTNLLMKMAADGTITYSQGMPSTTYSGASAGVTALDGRFWFVHNAGLDRVEDSGSITEYHIPWANAVPSGIALGGDGNIWFTDYNTGQIGQLVVSTATSGGQATINGSAPVGKYLAEALFLPPPFAASATATPDRLYEGEAVGVTGGSPCSSARLLARQDVKTPGNLQVSSFSEPVLSCSDLWIAFNGIGRIHRGGTGGTVVLTIGNSGTEPVAPTIRVVSRGLSFQFRGGTIIVHGKETPIDDRTQQATSSELLAPGETATVVLDYSVDVGYAYIGLTGADVEASIFSGAMDPAISNNTFAKTVNFDTGFTSLPAPPGTNAPLPVVSKRGGS